MPALKFAYYHDYNWKGITFKGYVREVLLREDDKQLRIRSYYKRRHIPTVLTTSDEDYVRACSWLQEQNIGWITLNYSFGWYLFLDKLYRSSSKSDALVTATPSMANLVVGSIPALFVPEKLNFITPPTVADEQSDYPVLRTFVDLLLAHYASDEVAWVYRYRRYKSKAINLSNPAPKSLVTTIGNFI